MNMSPVYLVNYRPQGVEALKGITQLSEEEALMVADKINADYLKIGNPRFGSDFIRYYRDRVEVEKRLYDGFVAINGKPKMKHPLYFFVHEWDACRKWTDKIIVKIALDEIEKCDVSFTLGDSCVIRDKPIFDKDELLKLFDENGNDIEKLLDYTKRLVGQRVIEAQIWNDRYFEKSSERNSVDTIAERIKKRKEQ